MARRFVLAALLASSVSGLLTSCASSPKSPSSSSHEGSKVLTATVTDRRYEAPGSSRGGSYAGSGNYFLTFEAHDADRTVHYEFPVTRQQYFRYPEGSQVQLVLLDDQLREIRPKTD